jgi:hypothetical protein
LDSVSGRKLGDGRRRRRGSPRGNAADQPAHLPTGDGGDAVRRLHLIGTSAKDKPAGPKAVAAGIYPTRKLSMDNLPSWRIEYHGRI